MHDELIKLKLDKLINFEAICKWPIYKKTFRELLEDLGAVEGDNDFIGFDVKDPILDICPQKLSDDGMGYGINEEWFTEASTDGKSYINFFVEKELPSSELQEYTNTYINQLPK